MSILGVTTQIRTTNLEESIDFYISKLGFELAFKYEDFYAGIKAGDQEFHLKLIDNVDPSIEFAKEEEHFHLYLTTDNLELYAGNLKSSGVEFLKEIHETPWGMREFVVVDNQGHIIYFGQNR